MAKYNTYTKDHLADALLEIMETRPLSEISVSELADRAQVNRVSFYRNFKSKEEILLYRFNKRFAAWTETHEAMLSAEGDPYIQARDFFEFMLAERPLINTLLKANAFEGVLLEYLISAIGPSSDDQPEEAFYRAFHLHGVFGVYLEWVKQGMAQSPERMASLIVYEMNQPHESLLRRR